MRARARVCVNERDKGGGGGEGGRFITLFVSVK